MTPWAQAFRDHRMILLFVTVYCLCAAGEGFYFGVPLSNLADIFRYMALSIFLPFSLLSGFYVGSFCGHLAAKPKDGVGGAFENLNNTAYAYVTGKRFPYSILSFLTLQTGVFFLISKSMIAHANPFEKMKWDLDFAAWDKALHFGHYPHELVIPLVNAVHAGPALDWLYFLWFVAMTAAGGYNLFGDTQLHRRFRYLWGYVLSWALIGSVMATWFSSAGPVFFSKFHPGAGWPYDAISVNIRELLKTTSLFSEKAQRLLMVWEKNPKMFDPNAISAMPSMHLAMAWLMVLYAREIHKGLFAAALVFCALIFLGSVYFGFHYAVDGYVAIIAVSIIWWVTGKCLDRRYPRDLRLREENA